MHLPYFNLPTVFAILLAKEANMPIKSLMNYYTNNGNIYSSLFHYSPYLSGSSNVSINNNNIFCQRSINFEFTTIIR